jgi:hypothetical protein
LIYLAPGEKKVYDLEIEILNNKEAIDNAFKNII